MMSKPALLALRAASACQRSRLRISPESIALERWLPMNPTWVAIHETPEGDRGGKRLVLFETEPPPCHNSIPASAPCLCTASVIMACERISLSSQRVAYGRGESSEVGCTETYPVHTTPQPPSAFISRKPARMRGIVLVMPLACGTA